MGNYYQHADPIYLCMAICLVHERWIADGRKPGSDMRLLCSTRTHRPALVSEIVDEWHKLSGCDPDDDRFPYHESYVMQQWVSHRKLGNATKEAWLQATHSTVAALARQRRR